MGEFKLIDDFGSFHKKNASKTGRTDVLRRTVYFVVRCFIGAMSTNITK
jgi:hypothetical protein